MWHLLSIRLGIGVIVLLLALAVPATAQTRVVYWSITKVMRMIDNTRVPVNGRIVRIENESTLCSGEGRSIRRRGIRAWNRFECTYTTFTKRGVDRDLDFRIRVLGARRFVVFDAHWVVATR
jgi:hypothetical protein